jgi:hypothetical protein
MAVIIPLDAATAAEIHVLAEHGDPSQPSTFAAILWRFTVWYPSTIVFVGFSPRDGDFGWGMYTAKHGEFDDLVTDPAQYTLADRVLVGGWVPNKDGTWGSHT